MWIAREAEIREEGRAEGEAKGRKEGREEGRAEGQGVMAGLMQILLNAGLYDEAKRAASDPEYRTQLLHKYGLV